MLKEEEIEQITKIPDDLEEEEPKKDKKKDPKKVLAGKILAKKNREARLSLENHNKKQEENSFLDLSNKLIYIASLIGSGFTFYQMYKFFYPNKKNNEEVETNNVEEEVKIKKQTSIDMD